MTNHYFVIHHFNQPYFMHQMWFLTTPLNSTKLESQFYASNVFFPTILFYLKPYFLYRMWFLPLGNSTYNPLRIGPWQLVNSTISWAKLSFVSPPCSLALTLLSYNPSLHRTISPLFANYFKLPIGQIHKTILKNKKQKPNTRIWQYTFPLSMTTFPYLITTKANTI